LAALARVRRGQAIADALAAVTADLSREDRRLAAQLAYGVLRHRRLLDWWIQRHVRGILSPAVLDILRLAYVQKAFLDRIPDYAIVSAAVEQAKRVEPKAAGLVNAVLRRGLDDRPEPDHPAVRYSVPDWIAARWRRRWPADWEDILRLNNRLPPLTLRVARRASPDALVADLLARGIRAERSPLVPEAIRVWGTLWLEDWPPFQAGEVAVQDETSMVVAHVLGPAPGLRVIDLAAGVGGKTAHLLDLEPSLEVVAVDISAERLARLKANLDRLGGTKPVEVRAADALTLPAEWDGTFDRVLLDAPCSALGVLRRRVDARWRKRPEDLARYAALETALAERAVRLVKPGGILVYSVCSLEPEETVEVVEGVLSRHPELTPDPVGPWLPTPALRKLARGGFWQVRPGQADAIDGFFIARLAKTEGGTAGRRPQAP
jgi:16S rRNA (cytosine967-C5)-methyltransferase